MESSNVNRDALESQFYLQLSDLYDAELRSIDVLPMMAELAHFGELKLTLVANLQATRRHVSDLECIYEELTVTPQLRTCEAMQALLNNGRSLLAGSQADYVRDAGLISVAKRIKDYEIAGYGFARLCAKQLGLVKVATLLQAILEEVATSKVAISDIGDHLALTHADVHAESRDSKPAFGI